MRKHYLDNLRSLTILLLFPVHTFMIWNDFGTKFYIWGGENKILSSLIVLVNPWFMPILFVIAGISARYSLEKRGTAGFIRQRVHKLLIPFFGGMVLLVPFQTLYARKFFFRYEGGIIENLIYFYTHLTDFSGYDGAFTPGHLWFILFLFLISLSALPVTIYLPYEKIRSTVERANIWIVIGMFIPVWLMYYLGNFGGFSLGKGFALYVLGFYLLGNDAVMERLGRNTGWLVAVYAPAAAGLVISYYKYSYYGDLLVNFTGWTAILVLLVLGKRYLNRKTVFTEYFNQASYPVYILHQSILTALGYYVLAACSHLAAQVAAICFGSFALTILCYHIVRNIPYLRKIAGIR